MSRRISESGRKFHKFLFRTVVCFILVIAGIIALDNRIRPSLISLCRIEGSRAATKVINDTVYNILDENKTDYSGYVTILYNSDGSVSSINTMTMTVNKLEAEILSKVTDSLNSGAMNTVEIPLGTASGMMIFMGRGPKVKAKIAPVGNASANLLSEFTSAGVNQTCHRIYIEVKASISAVMPMNIVNSDVTVKYLIAETVIVGKIPNSYMYFNGNSKKLYSDITEQTENEYQG